MFEKSVVSGLIGARKASYSQVFSPVLQGLIKFIILSFSFRKNCIFALIFLWFHSISSAYQKYKSKYSDGFSNRIQGEIMIPTRHYYVLFISPCRNRTCFEFFRFLPLRRVGFVIRAVHRYCWNRRLIRISHECWFCR